MPDASEKQNIILFLGSRKIYIFPYIFKVLFIITGKKTIFNPDILLAHWENRRSIKLRMFGIGTDFMKLKYPFVFYDILHVVDVLSRFPWVWNDKRFLEMVDCIENKRNEKGLFTPESVWMAFFS